MCGRTARNLDPDVIRHACRRGNWRSANNSGKGSSGSDWSSGGGDGRQTSSDLPVWRESPDGMNFMPSTNIAPGRYTPVLLYGDHVGISQTVLQPMRWGLLPSWFKGEVRSFDLKTSNARAEGLLQKRMFSEALNKGRRCVVVAEGFYEWKQAGSGRKQPYFIYDRDGAPLLKMAGVFDINEQNGQKLFSYSVITIEAAGAMSSVHHRMPVMLMNDDDVETWLNYRNVRLEQAVELLKANDVVTMHPVSTLVNDARNQSTQCTKKIDLEVKSKSATFLTQWLKRKNDGVAGNDGKKLKE